MSLRVNSGLTTGLPPKSGSTSSKQTTTDSPSVVGGVQKRLFGQPKPQELEIDEHPEVAAQIRLLHRYRKKLALLAGDKEDDYTIALCVHGAAMIDQEGTIFFGLNFLRSFAKQRALLVGVLAHEIGHRPKRWKNYDNPFERVGAQPEQQQKQEGQQSGSDAENPEAPPETLTALEAEREAERICLEEETRADIFAGKALAELGLPCKPLIRFVNGSQSTPHPHYHPGPVRAQVIREAYAGRDFSAAHRKRIFPKFFRATSVRHHVGEG